ncbi:MAG: Hsp33 family molecular chaperone HslO [Lachnospiraceae bacterium]|nr:Hsp33 family molecular chaperone HslO [Lachnospiraceae bacterium]
MDKVINVTEGDHIIRALAANGQIRSFAATTRNLTEYARQVHNTSPVVTAALGRTLTAGVMMGAMMKGEKDLLTIQIRGNGPMKGLTVTAGSPQVDTGMVDVKGYPLAADVVIPAKPAPVAGIRKLDVGGAIGNGVLSIIKDIGLKNPYVGQVALQTGEIAEDLTYYFATSEQIPSAVGLGVLMNRDNTVSQAGGFIIQLMPFADDEIISKLESMLKDMPPVTTLLDEGRTPEQLLEYVLGDFDIEINDRLPAQFKCNCDRARVEKALISLGKEELDKIVNEEKEEELKCQFCGKAYKFGAEDIKRLLTKAK